MSDSSEMDKPGAVLPRILTPMKRLQVSVPFMRTSSCLFNCSRWARFSSDSPAMLVTRSAGMEVTVMGEKISWSREMSLASIASIAISSTKRFKATCQVHKKASARVLQR